MQRATAIKTRLQSKVSRKAALKTLIAEESSVPRPAMSQEASPVAPVASLAPDTFYADLTRAVRASMPILISARKFREMFPRRMKIFPFVAWPHIYLAPISETTAIAVGVPTMLYCTTGLTGLDAADTACCCMVVTTTAMALSLFLRVDYELGKYPRGFFHDRAIIAEACGVVSSNRTWLTPGMADTTIPGVFVHGLYDVDEPPRVEIVNVAMIDGSSANARAVRYAVTIAYVPHYPTVVTYSHGLLKCIGVYLRAKFVDYIASTRYKIVFTERPSNQRFTERPSNQRFTERSSTQNVGTHTFDTIAEARQFLVTLSRK